MYKKSMKLNKKKWRKTYLKKNPWFKTYTHILNRVKNKNSLSYKRYRHIKILITPTELKRLWFRDRAYLMKQPSIDRLNSKGNYEFSNCRYIEFLENSAQGGRNGRNGGVPVKQLTLDGKLIKVWDSMTSATKVLGIKSNSDISHTCRGRQKTAKGYRWEYVNKRKGW